MPNLNGPLSSVRVELNVPVPMRDGIVLPADVYRPDAGGRFPVLLKRTPYNKDVDGRRAIYRDPIRVLHDGAHPSHITLPVIPTK